MRVGSPHALLNRRYSPSSTFKRIRLLGSLAAHHPGVALGHLAQAAIGCISLLSWTRAAASSPAASSLRRPAAKAPSSRCTRAQKVDRRGVRLTVGSQRLDYWTDEFLLHYIGKEVYLRYDPEDLSYVRAYDLQDRFIEQLPVDSDAVMDYHASAEQIKAGQRKTRAYEKMVGQQMAAMTLSEIGRDTRLRIALQQADEALAGSAGQPQAVPHLVELHLEQEQPLLKAVGSDIDLDRMIRNRLKENGGLDDE